MMKLLISKQNDLIYLDTEKDTVNRTLQIGCIRSSYVIEEDCEIIVRGDHCLKANKGDILLGLRNENGEWENNEWIVIPASYFGDYFKRTEEAINARRNDSDMKCCSCCDTCELR